MTQLDTGIRIVQDLISRICRIRNIVFVLFTLSLCGCYASTNLNNKDQYYVPDATTIEQGKISYQKYCIECHGENLDGNGPKAALLDPKPANLREKSLHFTQTAIKGVIDFPHYSRESIEDRIKYGNEAMPPLRDLLSSTEIENLVSYISVTIREDD